MFDLPAGGNSVDYSPFLEVLTRCYRRPNLLAVNRASLEAQVAADWLQTRLVDEIGEGIGCSYERLAAYAPNLAGRYIWILDDDDECIRPELVTELAGIVEGCHPDVIMLRMDHGPLGIKPEDAYWQHVPVYGHIGCSAYIVRRELWQKYAYAFRPGAYYSDYKFIASIFASSPAVYWHDVVASRVQRISEGRPE